MDYKKEVEIIPDGNRASWNQTDGAKTRSLTANALSEVESLALSVAQIGPAIEVLFVIGAIGAVIGVGAPLVILIAGIAYLMHANTTSEFSKSVVSAGGYTSYMERAFGRRGGVFSGWMYLFGFTGISSGFMLLVALWTQTAIQALFSFTVPWPICLIVVAAILTTVMLRGVVISSKVAIALFAFELVVVVVGLAVIALHSGTTFTAKAFTFTGFSSSGVAVAFPLAIFMFVGASNPAPMSEEIANPTKSVSRAVLMAVVTATVLFTIASMIIDAGYQNSATALSKVAIPFLSAPGIVHSTLLSDFIYIAGFTSVCSIFLAGFNGGSRVIYSLANRGIIPSVLGKLNRHNVPGNAIVAAISTWGVLALLGGWYFGLSTGFGDIAGIGSDTYVVLLTIVNFALVAFYMKGKGAERNASKVWLQVILPIIGAIVLGYVLWESIKPGASGVPGWDWLIVAVITVIAIVAGASYRSSIDNEV